MPTLVNVTTVRHLICLPDCLPDCNPEWCEPNSDNDPDGCKVKKQQIKTKGENYANTY